MATEWFIPQIDTRKLASYWITDLKGNILLLDNTTGALIWKMLEQSEKIRNLEAQINRNENKISTATI